MDISRPELVTKRRRRRLLGLAITVLAVVAVAYYVLQLKPAVPVVNRGAIWLDTVERGELLRRVRGNGALIPDQVLVVPTEIGGRVVRIDVLPGAVVEPDTILLELSNPPLKQRAFELEFQVKGARATLKRLGVQLDETRLALESKVAELVSKQNLAKLEAKADREL